MDDQLLNDLTIFIGGIKREVVRERITKGLVFDEGKKQCRMKFINIYVNHYLKVTR